MKKYVLISLVSGLIGFVAGNAFWYLASPLWIDRVVAESLPAELQMHETRNGSFRSADASHQGKGRVSVFETASGTKVIRFQDFEVTNGPDLKVWLVKAANISAAKDVSASQWLSLGPLKGNIGDQNYSIPADAPLAEYNSVVIWCEQFGVLFAAADLQTKT
jgi:hypothetical protein